MRRRVADGLGDDVKLTKIANPYDTEADKRNGHHYGDGRVWDDACIEQMKADENAVDKAFNPDYLKRGDFIREGRMQALNSMHGHFVKNNNGSLLTSPIEKSAIIIRFTKGEWTAFRRWARTGM